MARDSEGTSRGSRRSIHGQTRKPYGTTEVQGTEVVVEVHKNVTDANRQNQKVFDVTPGVTSVTWFHSVSRDYGGISLSLKAPFGTLLSFGMPDPGDHIVIRTMMAREPGSRFKGTGNAPVTAWGVVKSVSTGQTALPTGHIQNNLITVECESWFDMLGRVKLIAAPGISNDSSVFAPGSMRNMSRPQLSAMGIGYFPTALLGLDVWHQITRLFKQSISLGVGRTFQALVKSIPMPFMPRSLGDVPMSSLIEVLYNSKQCNRFAGTPLYDHFGAKSRKSDAIVVGTNLRSFNTFAGVNGPSILDLFLSLFQGDPRLVELFPSLEDAGFAYSGDEPGDFARSQGVGQPSSIEQVQSAYKRAYAQGELLPGSDAERRLADGRNVEILSKMLPIDTATSSLGRNPTIIYRICPWAPMKLSDFSYKLKKIKRHGHDLIKPTGFSTLPGTNLDVVTWDPENAPIIKLESMIAFSQNIQIEDKCNCVIVDLPGMSDTPVRFFNSIGLPLAEMAGSDGVGRMGLFPNQYQWPFISLRAETTAVQQSLVELAREIAYLSFMFHINGDRFSSGTVVCGYQPNIRHGEIVKIEAPKGAVPKRIGKTMIAYCSRVEHSIQVGADGSKQARTTVFYTRGLFNEAGGRVPFAEDIAKQTSEEQDIGS